ncbi:MAG: hypothetical protein A3D39_03860 [Candidatus Buchananbacteria bacterium RIFCSPHIGHO2_02_FULL_39_17]|nr:MAG: hypothetical protein A3D39_03860 [Candidatus Buchananbacteria bacterium RIFCSPHIGHO2_02_FULL_39_17]
MFLLLSDTLLEDEVGSVEKVVWAVEFVPFLMYLEKRHQQYILRPAVQTLPIGRYLQELASCSLTYHDAFFY